MSVNQLLNQLGFSPKEIAVYLSLLELGRAQGQLIAKRSNINRSTCYQVLNSLIDKGVVSVHIEQGVSFFSVNPADTFLSLVQSEKKAIAAKEERALELTKLIAPLFKNKHFSIPSLQFFDGAKNVGSMLERFLPLWLQSMKDNDNILWGYQDPSLVEHYRPWLEKYWETKDPAHQIKLFSNEAGVEAELKNKIKQREIRVFRGDLQLSTTLWISGDYITLIMTNHKPHYAFQIHDSTFANNLRLVFKGFWELAGMFK